MDEALRGLLDPLRAAPRQTGVFLDFDGTLAHIVDDPATATAVEGVSAAIDALALKFSVVAVVSGRPVEFLRDRLGVSPTVRLHGLYGLQHLKHGVVTENPSASKWRSIVDEGATTAEARLPRELHVERKGMSFVLHYRRAPELANMAEEWAARFAGTSGLDAQRGRQSIEIGPFLDFDKGSAFSQLTEGLSNACIIGDDIGDLPMFEAARELAQSKPFKPLNIAVESVEIPPALLAVADATVAGPDEVLEVLRYLTD